MELLPDINKYFTEDIVSRFPEIIQSRSNFQIQNFVLNQHDTDEMKYMQCINELQNLYYTIKKVTLDLKKAEIEIDRLRKTGDEIDEIEAQKKEIFLEETRIIGVGAFRELDILLNILHSFPRYTRKDIEENQKIYWEKRLSRQALFDSISSNTSHSAQLESLRQIGAIDIKGKETELFFNNSKSIEFKDSN